MKTVSAIILTAALAAALAAPAAAADWFWGLSYEPSVLMGDAKDFVDDGFSWRGVGFEGRTWRTKDVTMGFAVSWHVFHDEPEWATYSIGGADVTGDQFRDLNAVPIHLTAHRYWGEEHDWRPFVGLNVGTTYSERRVDAGLYRYSEDRWQFSFAPEVGALLPYYRKLGYVALRWHYALDSGGDGDTMYLTLRVGIGLR